MRDAASPCQSLHGLEFHPHDVSSSPEQLAGSSDALHRGNVRFSKLRVNMCMPQQGKEDLKSRDVRGNIIPVSEDRVDDIWRTDRKQCAVVLHDYLRQGSCVEFSTVFEERSDGIMERDSNQQNGMRCNKDDEAITLDVDKVYARQSTSSPGGMFATHSTRVVTLTQDLSEADSEILTCPAVEHSSNKLETLRSTVDTERSCLSNDVEPHSIVTRTRQTGKRASQVQQHESKRAKKLRGRGAVDKTTSHHSRETDHQLTSSKDRRDQHDAGEKVIQRAGSKTGYVDRQGKISGSGRGKKTAAPRKVNKHIARFSFDETARNNTTASPTKKEGDDYCRRRHDLEKNLRQGVVNKEDRSARDARYRSKIRVRDVSFTMWLHLLVCEAKWLIS